jgi:hypothetical protein
MLERLPQIVTCDGKEQRLEIIKFLWLPGSGHAPGDWPPRRPDGIEGPFARRPICPSMLRIVLSLSCLTFGSIAASGGPKRTQSSAVAWGSETAKLVSGMTDEGAFERLATAVLRVAEPFIDSKSGSLAERQQRLKEWFRPARPSMTGLRKTSTS